MCGWKCALNRRKTNKHNAQFSIRAKHSLSLQTEMWKNTSTSQKDAPQNDIKEKCLHFNHRVTCTYSPISDNDDDVRAWFALSILIPV